jgi:hypothetical protein
MSTCNRFDLETRGSQPIRSKNLPRHRIEHGLDQRGYDMRGKNSFLINHCFVVEPDNIIQYLILRGYFLVKRRVY